MYIPLFIKRMQQTKLANSKIYKHKKTLTKKNKDFTIKFGSADYLITELALMNWLKFPDIQYC